MTLNRFCNLYTVYAIETSVLYISASMSYLTRRSVASTKNDSTNLYNLIASQSEQTIHSFTMSSFLDIITSQASRTDLQEHGRGRQQLAAEAMTQGVYWMQLATGCHRTGHSLVFGSLQHPLQVNIQQMHLQKNNT